MVNQDNRPALRFWLMHPNELRKLIKECVLEVLMENLDGSVWASRGFQVGAKVKSIYGNIGIVKDHYVDNEHLTVQWSDGKLSEVHYTWITPVEMKEGFDPLSQGPNVPEENPYPAWNSQMRALEETEDTETHGRYAQEAGAGQFDPRSFCVCKECGNKFNYNSVSEIAMGSVKCPSCQTIIDQEGTPSIKIS